MSKRAKKRNFSHHFRQDNPESANLLHVSNVARVIEKSSDSVIEMRYVRGELTKLVFIVLFFIFLFVVIHNLLTKTSALNGLIGALKI